jgi:hypothetical protein
MKSTKYCLKEGDGRGLREYDRGDELDQSVLYVSMELPQ